MDAIALSLTLVVFGVLLIALSYQRHRHHRDLSALLHGISGLALAIAGLLLLTLTLNFNTYDPLTSDEPLAELTVERVAAKTFNVRLMRIPAGDLQVLALSGDQWQMEARLLRWQGWSKLLGLDTNLRLERLNSIDSSAPTAVANRYLLNRTPGVRLVALQQRFPKLLDFFSAQTLQTEALTLQDGLRYQLYYHDGALLARAINQAKVAKSTAAARSKPTTPSAIADDESASPDTAPPAEPAPQEP